MDKDTLAGPVKKPAWNFGRSQPLASSPQSATRRTAPAPKKKRPSLTFAVAPGTILAVSP